jgi:hypothetical protein
MVFGRSVNFSVDLRTAMKGKTVSIIGAIVVCMVIGAFIHAAIFPIPDPCPPGNNSVIDSLRTANVQLEAQAMFQRSQREQAELELQQFRSSRPSPTERVNNAYTGLRNVSVDSLANILLAAPEEKQ